MGKSSRDRKKTQSTFKRHKDRLFNRKSTLLYPRAAYKKVAHLGGMRDVKGETITALDLVTRKLFDILAPNILAIMESDKKPRKTVRKRDIKMAYELAFPGQKVYG